MTGANPSRWHWSDWVVFLHVSVTMFLVNSFDRTTVHPNGYLITGRGWPFFYETHYRTVGASPMPPVELLPLMWDVIFSLLVIVLLVPLFKWWRRTRFRVHFTTCYLLVAVASALIWLNFFFPSPNPGVGWPIQVIPYQRMPASVILIFNFSIAAYLLLSVIFIVEGLVPYYARWKSSSPTRTADR